MYILSRRQKSHHGVLILFLAASDMQQDIWYKIEARMHSIILYCTTVCPRYAPSQRDLLDNSKVKKNFIQIIKIKIWPDYSPDFNTLFIWSILSPTRFYPPLFLTRLIIFVPTLNDYLVFLQIFISPLQILGPPDFNAPLTTINILQITCAD